MSVRMPCAALLFVVLALAACGEEQMSSAPSAPATNRPAADTTAAPPDATAPPDSSAAIWTTGITDWAPAERPRMTRLQAVRTGRHDAFDRTVFAFAGDSLPGYRIEYLDAPARQCGSGHTVSLTGDGRLEVQLAPARAHTDAGRPTVNERERAPGLPLLEELKLTCDFEGRVTWVLGLSTPSRYRVLRLHAPARLVVDVRR